MYSSESCWFKEWGWLSALWECMIIDEHLLAEMNIILYNAKINTSIVYRVKTVNETA